MSFALILPVCLLRARTTCIDERTELALFRRLRSLPSKSGHNGEQGVPSRCPTLGGARLRICLRSPAAPPLPRTHPADVFASRAHACFDPERRLDPGTHACLVDTGRCDPRSAHGRRNIHAFGVPGARRSAMALG